MSEVNIKHSVVFVTGANRGIGRAITEEALARGAKKVYAAARDTASLDPLVEEYPDRVVPIRLDVTDAVQIEEAAGTGCRYRDSRQQRGRRRVFWFRLWT